MELGGRDRGAEPRGRTVGEPSVSVVKIPNRFTIVTGPLNISHLFCHFPASGLLTCKTRSRTHRLPALQWLMLASCPSAHPAFCLAEHLHSADPCWWIAFDRNSRSPLREQPWAQLQGQVSPRCPWVRLSSELSLCSVLLSQAAGMTLYLWESTFPNAGLFLIQKAG